jgi:acyl-coenzyme A thioesterase 9
MAERSIPGAIYSLIPFKSNTRKISTSTMTAAAMACRGTSARRLLSSISSYKIPQNLRSLPSLLTRRNLHSTPVRQTDGVFHGLTDNRTRMPWIEAFRQQQEGKTVVPDEDDPQERDLTPKKMSDSYHRVVLPLGRDPSLSDTYINSSGHIRYSLL